MSMLQIPVGKSQKKIIIHPINNPFLSLGILAIQPLRLFTRTLFTAKVKLMISIYLFPFKTFIFELLMAFNKGNNTKVENPLGTVWLR